MNQFKVVTTEELQVLMAHAIERDYNRQLDPERVNEMIDPDGIHVLALLMLHEHRAGMRTDPHYRCRILMKPADSDNPIEGYIDMDIEVFNALEDAHASAESNNG